MAWCAPLGDKTWEWGAMMAVLRRCQDDNGISGELICQAPPLLATLPPCLLATCSLSLPLYLCTVQAAPTRETGDRDGVSGRVRDVFQ